MDHTECGPNESTSVNVKNYMYYKFKKKRVKKFVKKIEIISGNNILP